MRLFRRKKKNRNPKRPAETVNVKFLNLADSPEHWLNDPATKPKYTLPEYPNDLQVIIHQGGPKTSKFPPELAWVRTIGRSGNFFLGVLLNAPHNLPKLGLGHEITFLIENGGEHPHLVPPAYLLERAAWKITPCDQCGFHEFFDTPSMLISTAFGEAMIDKTDMFTTFCGFCGGVQGAERIQ